MEFAKPNYLYCFIPLLLIGLMLFFLAKRKAAAINRLGDPNLIAKLSTTVNISGRRWHNALWFIAFALLIVAMARPRWGTQVEHVQRQGLEIMVALDISDSMLAEDFKPNRLIRAKQEISELMDKLGGNEIGLVLFSGVAFVQFPLTSDFATARMFLDSAKPGIITKKGTAIADAIEVAQTGFNEDRASQKVIILLTDGENYEGDVIAVAEKAGQEKVTIYTIGFGSPNGEPIPEYDKMGNLIDYKKDKDGTIVLTRLEEQTLQQIAIATNGRYFRAAGDGREVGFLADAIGKLQTGELESSFETRGIERFQLFLAVAIVALTARELISDRKQKKKKGLTDNEKK